MILFVFFIRLTAWRSWGHENITANVFRNTFNPTCKVDFSSFHIGGDLHSDEGNFRQFHRRRCERFFRHGFSSPLRDANNFSSPPGSARVYTNGHFEFREVTPNRAALDRGQSAWQSEISRRVGIMAGPASSIRLLVSTEAALPSPSCRILPRTVGASPTPGAGR